MLSPQPLFKRTLMPPKHKGVHDGKSTASTATGDVVPPPVKRPRADQLFDAECAGEFFFPAVPCHSDHVAS